MGKTLFAVLALVSAASTPAVAAQSSNHAQSFVEEVQTGIASYYARKFEGRRTASGDTFRHDALTAAHRSYPFGTVVRVTTDRDRSVIVRITDRLPSKQAIIDLTHKAASQLDMITAGKTRVTVQVLEWGKGGAKALRQVAQQAPVALTAATELLTAAGGLSSTDESK